jgi:cytidylate kinase
MTILISAINGIGKTYMAQKLPKKYHISSF